VPAGFELEDFSVRAHLAIVRFVVGTVLASTLLVGLRLMPFLGGKAGSAGAKRGSRTIGLKLLGRTLLEVPFAMVIAVGTQALSYTGVR
jgi:hypothetical protein